MIKINKNTNILTCKSVKYCSDKDEDNFFEWIKKISCIDHISGKGDELYLYIISNEIHDDDLRELVALFYRYKIDMKQLQQFLTKQNKNWFYDRQKSYWHKKVFGTREL